VTKYELGTVAADRGIQQRLPRNEAEKFDIMRRWLQEQWANFIHCVACEAGRPTLEHSDLCPRLPGWVIDVGGLPDALDEDVCLVDTGSLLVKHAPYVALSYRWGESNHLTTTTGTLRERCECIPLMDMPRTLQEAVTVTRRLGIRYIWIDALCIIQDDQNDWSREAAKMGEIYLNAYCTIAAHAAGHADDGFLEQSLNRAHAIPVGGNRDGELYEEETLAYEALKRQSVDEAKDASPSHQPLRQGDSMGVQDKTKGPDSSTRSECFFVTHGFYSRVLVDGSQLSSRGWALQERLLSQRTIHFTNDGSIYLESNAGLHRVDGGLEASDPLFTSTRSMLNWLVHQQWKGHVSYRNGESVRVTEISETPSAQALSCGYWSWYGIVERYSKCSLTKSEDRLLAISGIALKLQQFTGDKYYCGMWGQRFHQCLLWLREKERLQGAQCLRAPTWSWACCDGPVQFPCWSSNGDDRKIQPEIDIGNALSLSLPLQNSSIGILNGLALLELRQAVRIRTGLRFFNGQTGMPNLVDVVRFEVLKSQTRFWEVHDDLGKRIGWAALDAEERMYLDGEVDKITCVKIASHSDDRPESGFERGYLVLFITPSSLGPKSWFRVGMGQITETSWFENASGDTMYLF
jgi:Heterokaryon incompatibility protein (HET)